MDNNPRSIGKATGVKTENHLSDINIQSIARDVLRNFVLIFLVAIIAGCTAFVVKTEKYDPQYTSSATFLVSTKDSSNNPYNNLSTTIQLNEIFQMILNSDALKDSVKKDLGVKTFDAKINAKVVDETNLLVLTVTAGSPRESYSILCSIIKNYPSFSGEVMGNAVMDIFDTPSVPKHPNNSSQAIKYATLFFIIGALGAVGVLVLMSYLNDTIKNERQVEVKLDAKHYTSIPHEKKRKRQGILVSDVTSSFKFEEAYNKMRTKVERESKKNGYKAFAVSSALENEGKTTVSANLAIVLARKDYRVLLVDFDFHNPAVRKILEIELDDEKDISNYYSAKNEKSIFDFVLNNKKLNIDLLLSNKGIFDIDNALYRSSLNDVVNELKEQYDFIIIDTPPITLVSDIDDVISSADADLIVVREDHAKAVEINDAIDIINGIGTPFLGVVLNDSVGGSSNKAYGYAYYGGYGHYGNYGKYGKYGKYSKYGRYEKYAKASSSLKRKYIEKEELDG